MTHSCSCNPGVATPCLGALSPAAATADRESVDWKQQSVTVAARGAVLAAHVPSLWAALGNKGRGRGRSDAASNGRTIECRDTIPLYSLTLHFCFSPIHLLCSSLVASLFPLSFVSIVITSFYR